jgi:uncharacterized membrane protein YbhN (UPF0104 family)
VHEEVNPRPWWRQRKVWWRIVRDVTSLALAVVLLVWGLPKVAGVGWTEIVEPLRGLHPGALALLAALQFTALLAITFTITGALPGLSHTKALIVNLAGSLVANTLPFGGAVAIGATYAMCRSWGFSRGAIGISIVLGGVFATAGKVVLTLLGLAALVLQGGHVSPALRNAALFGVLTLVAVLVVFVIVMVSSRAAHLVGGWIQGIAQGFLRVIRRPRELGWDAAIARLRDQTRGVMRTGWLSMTLGSLGYLAIYFLLFCVCFRLTGLVTGIGTLLAAFALGRLLTSVGVTPGGIGLVEAGSVALLVAMGADPAQAASGILLFTIFTHILEIPLGVVAWLVWLWGRKPGIEHDDAPGHSVAEMLDDAASISVPAPGGPNGEPPGRGG